MISTDANEQSELGETKLSSSRGMLIAVVRDAVYMACQHHLLATILSSIPTSPHQMYYYKQEQVKSS